MIPVVLLLLVFAGPSRANDLQNIKVVTSNFPPFSYEENGVLKGVAVDRMQRIFKELNISPEIDIFPWARAYLTAEKTPNTLIFSIARSQKRENLFKWVGEITAFDVRVYRRFDHDHIQIQNLADMKNYRVVGLLKDIKTSYLESKGIQVNKIRSEDLGLNMMLRDRNAMAYRVNKLGLKENSFVPVLALPELSRPLYAAFNKETPDAVVEKFREALLKVARQDLSRE